MNKKYIIKDNLMRKINRSSLVEKGFISLYFRRRIMITTNFFIFKS